MFLKNKDIRIVNLNINKAAEVINSYLEDNNFSIESKKQISPDNLFLAASNKQKSPFKLLKTNEPQIFKCNFFKEKEKQTRIETKFDLLKNFRILIYGIVTGLVIISKLCMEKSIGTSIASGILETIILMALSSLAILFILIITKYSKYYDFLKFLYRRINSLTELKEKILQPAMHPELIRLPVFFVLGLVLIFYNDFVEMAHEIQSVPLAAILVIYLMSFFAVVFLLFICMFFIRESALRTTFNILGMAIAMAVLFYSNIPTINASFAARIVEKMESERLDYFKRAENISNIEKNRVKFVRTNRISAFLLFFCIWIGPLIFSIAFISNLSLPVTIIQELDFFRTDVARSIYYKSLRPSLSHSVVAFLIVLIWITVSIGIIFGIFITFSIVGKCLFYNYFEGSRIGTLFIQNTNIIFKNILDEIFTEDTIRKVSQAMIVCYCIPIIIIFCLVLEKNLRKMIKTLLALKKTNHNYTVEKGSIQQRLTEICCFAERKNPLVIIEESNLIDARLKYLSFPLFRNIIEVTKGAIDGLALSELEALLAHEVGHLKNNTGIKFMVLNFLSDWTLFGNGFLAITQNSIKIENEADDFAIEWLEEGSEKDTGKHAFIRLLDKLEKLSIYKLFGHVKSELANSNTLSYSDSDWLSLELRKNIDSYSEKNILNKIKISIWAFYHLYFSERVMSYFHPSIEERLERIEQ